MQSDTITVAPETRTQTDSIEEELAPTRLAPDALLPSAESPTTSNAQDLRTQTDATVADELSAVQRIETSQSQPTVSTNASISISEESRIGSPSHSMDMDTSISQPPTTPSEGLQELDDLRSSSQGLQELDNLPSSSQSLFVPPPSSSSATITRSAGNRSSKKRKVISSSSSDDTPPETSDLHYGGNRAQLRRTRTRK